MSGSRKKALTKIAFMDYEKARKIYGPKLRSYKSYFRRLKKFYTRGALKDRMVTA